MESQELKVEVRKKKGRKLDPFLEGRLNRNPSGFGYSVINYTCKDIRLARVTGEVQRFPKESVIIPEDLRGSVIVIDTVNFSSVWELEDYVSETKAAIDYESLSDLSFIKQKIDYLEGLIPQERKKTDLRKSLISPNNRDQTFIQAKFCFQYQFDEGGVDRNVLLEGLDLYIGPINDSRFVHPFCSLVSPELRRIIEDNTDKTTVYSVTMVDNSGHSSSRYFRAGSEILEIVPHRDHNRKDGIYQTVTKTNSEGVRKTKSLESIDLNELGVETGFHRNKEDVDMKFKDRMDLDKLCAERDLTIAKHEAAMRESDAKIRELEMKHQAAIRDMQRAHEEQTRKFEWEAQRQSLEIQNKERTYQIEQQRLVRNDHFDERKAVRSDYMESSKFFYGLGGALLTGILGFLAYKAK